MLQIKIVPDSAISQFISSLTLGIAYPIIKTESCKFIETTYLGDPVAKFDSIIVKSKGMHSSNVTFISKSLEVNNPVFMNYHLYNILTGNA